MRLPNLSIAEDSNDEYNTPWIPVGTGSLVLRSDADGHLPWSQDGIKVLREAEPQTFEVELKRGLSIQFMLKAGSERLPLDKPILLLREDELPLVKRLGTSAWRAGPMFPGQSIVSSRQVLCQPPTAGRPAVPATIRALEPGTYHLATFAEGMQVTPETVEVAAGQAGPVELSWSME